MVLGIEAALLQLPVIIGRLGAERQKAQEEFLVARFFSLQEQRLNMVWQFVVLVAVIAADMFSDQLFLVIDQQAVRPPLQGESAGSILAGDGVAVAIDPEAKLAVHPYGVHDGGLIRDWMEGLELFLEEKLLRDFLRLAVLA